MPGRRRKPGVRQEGPGIRLVCQHGEADEEKIGICARMAVARISQKRIRGYCRREYRHGSKRNQKEPKFQRGSGADAMGKISRRGRVIFPCSISPLRQTQKSTGRPRNPVLEKAILPAKLPRPFLGTHRVLGRRKAAAKGKSDGLGTGSGCPRRAVLCRSPYP